MEIVTENSTSLAWIGDAFYTLKVREHLLSKGYGKPSLLEKKQAGFNSAKSQAKILEKLMKEDSFSEDELEILRRGRNANIHTKAKNTDLETYLQATALEALLGYLYLYGHHERLSELMSRILTLGESL